MAIALGILGRGVLNDERFLDGVVVSEPTLAFVRPDKVGFGVLNGETALREGDRESEACIEDEIIRIGLLISEGFRGGLVIPESRELSCLAVIPIYLEAREPAVILVEIDELLVLT